MNSKKLLIPVAFVLIGSVFPLLANSAYNPGKCVLGTSDLGGSSDCTPANDNMAYPKILWGTTGMGTASCGTNEQFNQPCGKVTGSASE